MPNLEENHLPKERAASKINVKDFDSKNDDFEKWVKLFEIAVKLATNAVGDRRQILYKEWLPLKLDDHARGLHETIDEQSTWEEIKNQLATDLIDPQEQAKWQDGIITVKWDGTESILSLANQVKRLVDKYERDMPRQYKEREYFDRFLAAFKKPMRRFIKMACPTDDRSLDTAMEAAQRYQLAHADGDTDERGTGSQKSVSFNAGILHADRATSVEKSMAEISTQLENLSITFHKSNEKIQSEIRSLSDRIAKLEESDRRRRERSLDNRSSTQSTSQDRDGYRRSNDHSQDDRENRREDRRRDDRRDGDDRRNDRRRDYDRRQDDDRHRDNRRQDSDRHRDNRRRDDDRHRDDRRRDDRRRDDRSQDDRCQEDDDPV